MQTTASFGYWVRRRRKALDLTQADLARRVGCAVVTLRKIEADQRRPSPPMAERLAQALELSASELARFRAAARGEEATFRLPLPTAPAEKSRSNLPASVNALIGREDELATITNCLRRNDVRLLTLTGPVGVGKTRLAIEAGRRLLPAFADGVYLVALAAVQDPAFVPAATAAVLEVRETGERGLAQAVADFLAPRALLLIFDNYEHLLPAALFVSTLLATCPRLHVLVTSRTRLHLYGEHVFNIPPLQLPTGSDVEALAAAPAVRLFCERAAAVRADFCLTPSVAPTVSEICRRLDGLPLAIELAAARLNLFSPAELLQRLEHPLPTLAQTAVDLPPRLQGLESAISWSYGLLTPAQRTLLARSAVFIDGFTLAAAESVCALVADAARPSACHTAGGPQPSLAAELDALLGHSLLQRGTLHTRRAAESRVPCAVCPRQPLVAAAQAETRFALLATIRAFALEQLQANGELAVMQQRHATYFVDWAAAAAEQLQGPDQAVWLERLEAETGNLRAALRWLLTASAVEMAARLACSLSEFWQRRGYYSEGRRWLQQVLARMTQASPADSLRARTLQAAAMLAYRQGDRQTAQQWLNESLTTFRMRADARGLAKALGDLGWIALEQGEWTEALRLNQESLALARATDDPCAKVRALTNLGWAQLCRGAVEVAAEYFHQAHAAAERVGHVKGIAVSLANLGWVALHQNDAVRSATLAQESLRLCYLLGEREALAECLEILALSAATQGDLARGRQLHAGAATLWQALGVTQPPSRQVGAGLGRIMRQQGEDASPASLRRHGPAPTIVDLAALAWGCQHASGCGAG